MLLAAFKTVSSRNEFLFPLDNNADLFRSVSGLLMPHGLYFLGAYFMKHIKCLYLRYLFRELMIDVIIFLQ